MRKRLPAKERRLLSTGLALALHGASDHAPGQDREDVSIAKNCLTETELQPLNRIVNAYLEFAELRWSRRGRA